MRKITRTQKNWLAIHEDTNVRETVLDLCAQGRRSQDIAEHMQDQGLVELCTADDIDYYKQVNAEQITAYLEANAKRLLSKMPRTKKAYRIGELDKILDLIKDQIPALIEDKPSVAVQFTKILMQGQQQIAVEVGDLLNAAEPTNKWIELLQVVDTETKIKLMTLLNELDRIASTAGQRQLPDPRVVDADYTVEEA